MHTEWRVFLCYRRVDGSDTAIWLYKKLNRRALPSALIERDTPSELEVYFDQAAPAVDDWHQIHKPALEQSRALIVVCSPGLFVKLDTEDWVHEELDWWLANRSSSPIIIDQTGEGVRWIPNAIKQRWPNAQRVDIDLEAWKKISPSDRALQEEIVIERIVGGIAASEAKTRREDANREHALNTRLRRSLMLTGCLLFVALLGIGASLWFSSQAREGQRALNRQFAVSLMEQAEDAWAENDETAARALAARAVSYDNSDVVMHRYHMLHDWMEERYEQAQQHVEQTLEIEYQQAIDIALLPHLAERLAKGRSAQRSLGNFLALGAKLHKAQYDSVLRFKDLSYRIEVATHTKLFEHQNQQNLLEELRLAQAKISLLAYQVPRDDEHRSEWMKHYITAARRLAAAYHDVIPTELPHDSNLQWHQLQDRLRDNEALVEYMYYRGRYAVWILKKNGKPVRYELGMASVIEDSAKKYRDIIRDPVSSAVSFLSCDRKKDAALRTRGVRLPFNENGGEVKSGAPSISLNRGVTIDRCQIAPDVLGFRKLIWDPVDKNLSDNIDTVYVVPDAMLATIPFSALPGQLPGTHLFEEILIVHLASSRDLLRSSMTQQSGKGVLLMGGADYGEQARQINPESFQARRLFELPGTLKEIETIEKRLREHKGVRPLVTYTDSAANERAFRQNGVGKRIIHLATHGWTDYQGNIPWIDPDLAYLPHNVEAYIATLNPLLRAGIALSPSGVEIADGQRDGVLTALEVSTLDLRGVELVVLSGCDTVGTRSGGQTAIGLFRAFREAGAQSVVASLYAVPDKPTADLMGRLYKDLSTYDTPAAALREAMREMKDKGLGPAFWAGFVTYSPTRIRIGEEEGASQR